MASDYTEIIVKGRKFVKSISADEINGIVTHLASKLNELFPSDEPVVFVCILKGSLIFTSDLIRAYHGQTYVEFIRCRSYQGLTSNRSPQIDYRSFESLHDKNVVVVEDIVETGHSLHLIVETIKRDRPKSLKTVALLQKPGCLECDVRLDFIGKTIEREFVIGYGLDYDGEVRHLPDIYRLVETIQ